MTGGSNVLVAYFSLTNNRVYTADEMDAVTSASLKVEDGIGYGHAELLAITAQEVTDMSLGAVLFILLVLHNILNLL